MEVFKIQIQRTKGGKKVIEERDVPVDVGTSGPGSVSSWMKMVKWILRHASAN